MFQKVNVQIWAELAVKIDLQVDVNGSEENPIFTYLKSNLPTPSDSKVAKLILLIMMKIGVDN